jgi:UDP-N-acetylmuramate dehydrogenase
MTDAPLIKLNTWRIGGAAKQLYEAPNLMALAEFLPTLAADDIPVWLGLGSNVLIPDSGISNTVILTHPGLGKLSLLDDQRFSLRGAETASLIDLSPITSIQREPLLDDKIFRVFRAEAGVTCAKVAKFCVKHDIVNGEFFAGIPGTVGGALRMNAGAFGGETWSAVIAVETINQRGEIKIRQASEYNVSYRTVTGPGITHGELEWFVAGHFTLPMGDGQITQQRIKELLKKRGETQPIGLPSCGSVFRNPPGHFAAKLIEECGLKGYRIGDAEVSSKHANFIINCGHATAQDIEQLILYVQTVVKEQHAIELIPEVKTLG